MSDRPARRRRARPARVRVEARAKINLGLAVGPRRPDGFHEIATIFQSISLADRLTVRRGRSDFSLEVRFADVSVPRPAASGGARPSAVRRATGRGVPAGPGNLVLRAARLLAARYRLPGGARFSLLKRIPAGAGLGGGSADAAAALTGLARLHRLRVTQAEWLALAAEIGSDVPFALLGGTALGLGRGERLGRLRLASPFRALLAVPPWRVSTARAFRALDRGKYALTLWTPKLRFAQALGREAIRPGEAARLGNTFEKVLGGRRSGFLSLRARLRRAGLEEPFLTGSGSAVFGILPAGLPGRRVVERFAGDEAIYLVRSRTTSLTHTTRP